MKKFTKELSAGLIATAAVVMVMLLTMELGLVGFIGALLIVFGGVTLYLEAEKAWGETHKQDEFSVMLKTSMKEFADSLNLPAPEAAILSSQLKDQCWQAKELDMAWERTVAGSEKIRLREADRVVRFEEAFYLYLNDLIGAARELSSFETMKEMMTKNCPLAEFRQYLVELGIELEMG